MEENDDKRVLKATGPEYLHNFNKMCVIPWDIYRYLNLVRKVLVCYSLFSNIHVGSRSKSIENSSFVIKSQGKSLSQSLLVSNDIYN